MITLALETSTARGSVAVAEAGVTLFHEEFRSDRGHSGQLFLSIERALATTPRPRQIAVGLGPGSYSGVRIAIAAAIGLSMGTGAALVGLPSIVAMDCVESEFLAIGDARRGTFYFSHVKDGEVIEGPALCVADELDEKIRDRRLRIVASDILAGYDSITVAFPSAEKLAHFAAANRGIVGRDHLDPLYLREPHITMPKRFP